MKMAAAQAIAGLIPDDELNEENILPRRLTPAWPTLWLPPCPGRKRKRRGPRMRPSVNCPPPPSPMRWSGCALKPTPSCPPMEGRAGQGRGRRTVAAGERNAGPFSKNLCTAKEKDLPICQDTGMACVFVELGQDAYRRRPDHRCQRGVRPRLREKAYLRKSITADPLQRVNTGDNTPAFSPLHLVPGDGCQITVAPKGAGSENMSRLTMLQAPPTACRA